MWCGVNCQMSTTLLSTTLLSNTLLSTTLLSTTLLSTTLLSTILLSTTLLSNTLQTAGENSKNISEEDLGYRVIFKDILLLTALLNICFISLGITRCTL